MSLFKKSLMDPWSGGGKPAVSFCMDMHPSTGKKKWSKYFFLPATLYTFEKNPKILSS